MTPEELAVVQAAMRWRDTVLAHPEALRPLDNAGNPLTPVLSELSRTTYALAVACPQCNAGGHVCPGDGNPIEHGEHACSEHDDTVADTLLGVPVQEVAGLPTNMPDTPPAIEPALIWVPRTWTDVRPGDRVRMPGSEVTAHVQNAVHLHWQVKPGTGTSAYNPPERLAFGAVQVTLNDTSYEMDPGKPVEIELAESEVYVLNGLGWENRIGLVTG